MNQSVHPNTTDNEFGVAVTLCLIRVIAVYRWGLFVSGLFYPGILYKEQACRKKRVYQPGNELEVRHTMSGSSNKQREFGT